MSWLQLCIAANKPEIEALEDALLASGAVSVTLEDGGRRSDSRTGGGRNPALE